MATSKTYQINIDVESKTLGELEGQLEDVNAQLKDVDRNSEAFKNLSKEAQVLTREIEKTNNEIEGLKLEDKLMAADGAAKVFGGSLSTVVGTLGVLGVESEAFGEFEKKAASAIAVGLGVKDVAEGFGNLSVVMKKSGIAAKLFGRTTSAALVATGIGAFVVALGLVVANFDGITKAAKRFANSVPFIGKAIEGVKNVFNSLFDAARPVLEFLGILPDEAERAQIKLAETTDENILLLKRELAVLEAAGADAKMIYDKRIELIDAEKKALELAGEEKGVLYEKDTEKLRLEAAERKRIRDKEEADEKARREKQLEQRQAEIDGFAEASETIREQLEPVGIQTLEVASATDQLAASVAGITPKLTEEQQAYVNSQKAIAAKNEQQKREREGLAATGQALGELGSVLNQESAAAKALAVSSAIINTYLGVTEVLKQPSTLPSPFDVITKVANVATILASGFQAVKGIKSASAGGGSPSGGGSVPVSGPRGAAASAEVPSFDVPQTLTAGNEQTVRAYVVGGDVRSTEEADAKLNNRRTLST